MKVTGTHVVVVGGGNGIGQQVVLELLKRGAKVSAVDLRADSLAATAGLAQAGERLATFPLDITDRQAVMALPEQARAAHGDVDGLINVAGIIQPFTPVVDLDVDTVSRVFNVNFFGTLHTVQAFLPGLMARPVAHLVNVSSMGAFVPVPGQTAYGASKAAVSLLTNGLYAELLDTNVTVTLVMPGAVATDITGNSGVASPIAADSPAAAKARTTDPATAARIIVDGMEADRLHVFVGRDARIMNLLSRLAPGASARMIQRKMKALLG